MTDFWENKDAAIRARATSDAEAIGRRCREARGAISQSWASMMIEQEQDVRLSTRALSEIETGKRSLKLSEAVALARAYGVELTSLTPDGSTRDDQMAVSGARELALIRNFIDQRLEILAEQVGE